LTTRRIPAGPLPHATKELDVRGYNCPIPLLRAKKILATMQRGEVLKIVATDPGAEIDFRVYAEASGNPILALEESGNVITILMAKQQA
jgi:tRNA 2-thiouridine synthesizing protein A